MPETCHKFADARTVFLLAGIGVLALLVLAVLAHPSQASTPCGPAPCYGGSDGSIQKYRWIDDTDASGRPKPTYSWPGISPGESGGGGTLVPGTCPATTCPTGGTLDEDEYSTVCVPFGFSFNYYGSAYTCAWVNSNGYLVLGTASSGAPSEAAAVQHTPTAMPWGGLPNGQVSGFWTDIDPSRCPSTTMGGAGGVFYQTTGPVGSRVFTVEYNGVFVWDTGPLGHTSECAFGLCVVTDETSCTYAWFAIQFLEGKDNIEVQLKSVKTPTITPIQATLGIEDTPGGLGLQYGFSTAESYAGRAIRYYHNLPPTATPATLIVNEDCTAAISASGCGAAFGSVTLTGTDPDGDVFSYCVSGSPVHGALVAPVPPSCPGGSGTSLLKYRPNADYCNGPAYVPETLSFAINDPFVASPLATLSIEVTCIPDTPVAFGETYNVNENCSPIPVIPATCGTNFFGVGAGCVTPPIGLRCNDSDRDDLQIPAPTPSHLSQTAASVVAGPSKGLLLRSDGTGPSPAVSPDGSFRYIPNDNFCGATDTFTYRLTDDQLPTTTPPSVVPPSNIATVTLNVLCVTFPPVANPDSYPVATGHALDTKAVNLPPVLANDSDPDTPYGDVISVASPLCSAPTFGSLTMVFTGPDAGHFVYTPLGGGWSGIDTFSYQAQDTNLPTPNLSGCVTVTLDVEVDWPIVTTFTAHPTTLHVGETVAFVDSSADPDEFIEGGGAPVGWNWDFGDGYTAHEPKPVHMYGSVGTFQACLRALDEWGVEGTLACVTITVLPPVGGGGGGSGTMPGEPIIPLPPGPHTLLVDAGSPTTVPEAATVTLHGLAPGTTAPTWSWTQLAGPHVTLTGATTANPTFTAPAVAGGVAVLYFGLDVHDGLDSGVDGVMVTVHSTNAAPVAQVASAATVRMGGLAHLDGSGSKDPNGDALSYHWTQWEGPRVMLANADSPQTTFTMPDAAGAHYRFALEVSDGRLSDVAVQVVDMQAVTVAPPSFAAVVGPDGTVRFTPDDLSQALRWDFGDGGPAQSAPGVASHRYAASGDYLVTVTAVDGAGQSHAASQMVTVALAQDHARSATASDSGLSWWPWAAIVGPVVLGLVGLLVMLLGRSRRAKNVI